MLIHATGAPAFSAASSGGSVGSQWTPRNRRPVAFPAASETSHRSGDRFDSRPGNAQNTRCRFSVGETMMSGSSHVALLGIGVAAGMLLWGAIVLFRRERSVSSFLQLIGAGCLAVVVFTHAAEAPHLFPSIHWGRMHSLGHY